MGPDDAGGWAIWLRDQPSGSVLRFGPDEGDTAERLFQQLEYFEVLAPETEVMPGQDRDDRSSSEEVEGSSRTAWGVTGTSDHHPSAVHPSHLQPTTQRRDRAPRAWLKPTRVGIASLAIAASTYLVTLLPLGDDPALSAGRSLFGREADALLPSVPPESSDPQLDRSAPSTLPGVEVHANSEGGYLFSYPESWTVEVQGGKTLLADPDDSVRVRFGTARDGSLSRTSASLVASVMRSHDGARVLTSSRESTPEGMRALIVGGTLPDDVEGRFLAIAVKATSANKAITVFFSAGSDVLEDLGAIRAILSSFRVGTGS